MRPQENIPPPPPNFGRLLDPPPIPNTCTFEYRLAGFHRFSSSNASRTPGVEQQRSQFFVHPFVHSIFCYTCTSPHRTGILEWSPSVLSNLHKVLDAMLFLSISPSVPKWTDAHASLNLWKLWHSHNPTDYTKHASIQPEKKIIAAPSRSLTFMWAKETFLQ